MQAPDRGRHSVALDDGRHRCEICPRECELKPGQRGFCFVREADEEGIRLTTWGRSSGFQVDPIEKKPLNHFYPGTRVLSFGTAGCNLGCKFCQNWSISKASDFDRLQSEATPEEIAENAKARECRSVAFTYNDPVIFYEYALDTAAACRAVDVKTVAVTAGYISARARPEFFAAMDAVNIDLKAFSEAFYRKLCLGHLEPVKETLAYVAQETTTWLEVTTLLIPGENDSDEELHALAAWFRETLGPEVPLHFTAFHPDFRMRSLHNTPLTTLRRARTIAHEYGLRYVYLGNVRDREGARTVCPSCKAAVIERDGYRITSTRMRDAACAVCGQNIAGRF